MFKNIINIKGIKNPAIMLLAMWSGFLLQKLAFFSHCFGAIIPLLPEGLLGIVTAPLLHGSVEHIIGNSVPVAILMFLLYQFYPAVANRVFFLGWVAAGFLLWLLPSMDIISGKLYYTCTIGASGVVYMLAFFLVFSGIFRWNMKLLTISLLVILYYGSLVWGIFPEEWLHRLEAPSTISWQAHLSGAVVGSFLAYFYRKKGEMKKKFIWQFPNYYNEKDDQLWQEYREKHPQDFEELPKYKKDNVWDRLDDLPRK